MFDQFVGLGILSELYSLYESFLELHCEVMRCVHLHHRVAECHHVFHVAVRQFGLGLEERVELPLGDLAGKARLVFCSCRDNRDLGQHGEHRWHKSLATKLDPAFTSVRYDVDPAVGHCELQHSLRGLFEELDVLHDVWSEVHVLIDSVWADEGRAEQRVIPVKDDRCLVRLRLLHRCQPNLFVCQSREQVFAQFIACAVFRHLVKSESVLTGFLLPDVCSLRLLDLSVAIGCRYLT